LSYGRLFAKPPGTLLPEGAGVKRPWRGAEAVVIMKAPGEQ